MAALLRLWVECLLSILPSEPSAEGEGEGDGDGEGDGTIPSLLLHWDYSLTGTSLLRLQLFRQPVSCAHEYKIEALLAALQMNTNTHSSLVHYRLILVLYCASLLSTTVSQSSPVLQLPVPERHVIPLSNSCVSCPASQQGLEPAIIPFVQVSYCPKPRYPAKIFERGGRRGGGGVLNSLLLPHPPSQLSSLHSLISNPLYSSTQWLLILHCSFWLNFSVVLLASSCNWTSLFSLQTIRPCLKCQPSQNTVRQTLVLAIIIILYRVWASERTPPFQPQWPSPIISYIVHPLLSFCRQSHGDFISMQQPDQTRQRRQTRRKSKQATTFS